MPRSKVYIEGTFDVEHDDGEDPEMFVKIWLNENLPQGHVRGFESTEESEV